MTLLPVNPDGTLVDPNDGISCDEWFRESFRALCSQDFHPADGDNTCEICVAPLRSSVQLGCFTCNNGVVPDSYQIVTSVGGMNSSLMLKDDTFSRSVISRLSGSGTSSAYYKVQARTADANGSFNLIPPIPWTTQPFYLGQNENPCAVRIYGEAEYWVTMKRPHQIAYTPSPVASWARPVRPATTDYGYGTVNNGGAASLELKYKVSPWENIPQYTLLQHGGVLDIYSGPWQSDPEYLAFINADPSNPPGVIVQYRGFMWVLKVSSGTSSGVPFLSGQLDLHRWHGADLIDFSVSGVWPTASLASSGATDPWPDFPTTSLYYSPQVSAVSSALAPVYVYNPMSIMSIPGGTISGPFRSPSSGLLIGMTGWPLSVNVDTAEYDPGMNSMSPYESKKASGSFQANCSKGTAKIDMATLNGAAGSVSIYW